MMKVYVEGCRAMTYFTSYCIDQTRVIAGEKKSRWQGLVDLLVPVVKAYNTDKAWQMTGMAIQCAGGYGYCSEYPFEQFARDCKVTTIYEGTNGIQAIDLIFRKLIQNNLVDFHRLISEMDKTIEEAKRTELIRKYAEMFEKAKIGLVDVINDQVALMKQGNVTNIYFNATPFLDAMGDVILGWIHLWQMTVCHGALMNLISEVRYDQLQNLSDCNKEIAYYYGKLLGARFYIGSVLKKTFGKFDHLRSKEDAALGMVENLFAA